jgi:RNA polymerase sigma-70 factor (ECF subfamily)
MNAAAVAALRPALASVSAQDPQPLVYAAARDALPSAATSPVSAARLDEDGIAALYAQYAPAIYAHCRRLLHSQSAARDAMQEAFVRVLAKGPRLLSGDDALRYLYRVSTNVCLNQLREQRVHERATPAIMARTSPSSSAERHADREFVLALLDRCDETGSAIAVMHYVDGLSQVEIADTLGITRRTVFNRLRKLEKIAEDLMSNKLDEPPLEDGADVMVKEKGGT